METLIGKVTAGALGTSLYARLLVQGAVAHAGHRAGDRGVVRGEEVGGRCSDDGFLPVSGVLWLLSVLRTTEQVMPTEEQVTDWTLREEIRVTCPDEWRRVLRRRKRRLAGLLDGLRSWRRR